MQGCWSQHLCGWSHQPHVCTVCTLCTISRENLQFLWFLPTKLVSWQLDSSISDMVEMVLVLEEEAPHTLLMVLALELMYPPTVY